MKLTRQTLDHPRFPAEQCEALFAAVLVDDEVDAETAWPAAIPLAYPQEQLITCFRLCRQLWLDGVDRRQLVALVGTLIRDRDLSADDRLRLRYIRAKFKHLRFAFALYDQTHSYPVRFDRLTKAMGKLQDAFRNGRRGETLRQALRLRLLLTWPVWAGLLQDISRLAPATGADFQRYIEQEAGTLRTLLVDSAVTGARFHAARKIVSRLVSFYDTIRTLTPSTEAMLMSRSLSAINGLMGQRHDELVAGGAAVGRDYHQETFQLTADLRRRLSEFLALMRVPQG